MKLKVNLPKPVLLIMEFVVAIGAVNAAISGIFSFDVIISLIGRTNELLTPLYFLVGFFGACLLIININYLLLKAKAKMIASKISK